eukprot:2370672-Pleurochrysis_carterae.AAC.1
MYELLRYAKCRLSRDSLADHPREQSSLAWSVLGPLASQLVLCRWCVPLLERMGYGTEAILRVCSRSNRATTRSRSCASR